MNPHFSIKKLSSSVTIPKKTLLQKPVFVYSTPKIVSPITKYNFINTHLHTIQETHVIAFADIHHAAFLKQANDEMCISQVTVSDIVPYLQCTKQDMLILEDGMCEIDTRDAVWYFYNVPFTTFEYDYIDCSIEAWTFKN